jgi:hypothetical protein
VIHKAAANVMPRSWPDTNNSSMIVEIFTIASEILLIERSVVYRLCRTDGAIDSPLLYGNSVL